MRGFKKFTSMLLIITMFFAGFYVTGTQTTQAATAADTWKNTAIVAPQEGKLIGAGYIDITWNNDLDGVSVYKVYVDGSYQQDVAPTPDATLSYEMYTTKVSAHTAYIVAVLNSGSEVQTATRTFYVTKKGVCVNTNDMGAAVDPADLNLGWYYDWGTQSFKELGYKNTKFYDLEFVPMIYGNPGEGYPKIFNRAKEQGYKYMLGYNEPDLSNESNIRADLAATRWKYYFMTNKGNMRLGSPAISTASPLVESNWWSTYWNALSDNEKDATSFIAVHKYYEYYNEDTAQEFLMLLDETYDKYKKPIWVTEFALWKFDKNSPEAYKAQEFMKIVCKGLNERDYVERYSWFCPDINSNAAGSSAIFDYSTGALTEIGKIYAQIGNPAGYNAKTYGVTSTTNVSTTVAGCVGAIATKVYTVLAKKKAFTYDIKETKRAVGYQIQYGQKKSMKGAKTKNVTALTGKIKVTFTKAQKKKIKKGKLKKVTFYVRVRAYKNIFGKNVYCKWSTMETVKVKTK